MFIKIYLKKFTKKDLRKYLLYILMAEGSKNNSLEINNNVLYNNMAQNGETKRKRGRPTKPSKIDLDLHKLNEIHIKGNLNNFFKDYIVGLYKRRNITRYNTAEKIIKSLNNKDVKKSAKIFQKIIKQYDAKTGIKEKNLNKKQQQVLDKADKILESRKPKKFYVSGISS